MTARATHYDDPRATALVDRACRLGRHAVTPADFQALAEAERDVAQHVVASPYEPRPGDPHWLTGPVLYWRAMPTAHCPQCRHRDPRTGRCRELPETYASQAPIRCTAYDGPPLPDQTEDEEET
jgi:hypothetical protein